MYEILFGPVIPTAAGAPATAQWRDLLFREAAHGISTPASREAAQECSPRRKPWVTESNEEISPEGAKQKSMVPSKGLEPPHPCEYMDLNHARLPIPPRWLVDFHCSRQPEGHRIRKTCISILQPRESLSNHAPITTRSTPTGSC